MTQPEQYWRRLIREPLVHFLALGAALFLIAPMSGGRESGARRIVVSNGRIENLAAAFEATWQRPPSEMELQALIADHIREEVLYREAVALGLDRDDLIVRRRMRQKVELMATSLSELAEPTEADLVEWLGKHPDRYRTEARLTFRQVYLSPEKRGAALPADASRLLAVLREGRAPADLSALGDSLMLSTDHADEPLSSIAAQFGKPFAARLADLPIAEWSGPVESGYGQHLVLVEGRVESRLPDLGEVRGTVARDWESARTDAAMEEFYQSLLKTYDVVVEAPEPSSDAAEAPPEATR